MPTIPQIDPNVRHISHRQLKKLDETDIKPDRTYVVHGADGQPMSVMVPYAVFMEMQEQLSAILP